MRLLRKIGFACALSLCATAAQAASVAYKITDIGSTLPLDSTPTAINKDGQIAGFYKTAFGDRAFLYDDAASTKFTTLTLPAPHDANGINDSGLVVGTSANKVFEYGAGAHDLSSLAGAAYAVNNAGVVVGSSGDKAFKTDGTTTTFLPLSAPFSSATGINSQGDIVGTTWTSGGSVRTAFVLPNGSTTPTSITAPSGNPLLVSSYANAISDKGVVVGYFREAGGMRHAFMYNMGAAQATLFDEHFIPSEAKDVNSSGKVVGFFTVGGLQHGFIYTPSEGMLDLNDLILPNASKQKLVITGAFSINDGNSIAAVARTVNDAGQWGAKTFAVRLDFVPLPSSALMGFGLLACVCGIGLVRRFRHAE